VRDVLARDLGAREIVVGYDFSFGRERRGDTRLLAGAGAALGIASPSSRRSRWMA